MASKLLVKQRSSRILCACKPYRLCSNPSKYPDMSGNVFKAKYLYLQAFCNLQKAPKIGHAAFTRQRTLVRFQHRPLNKSPANVGKREAPGFRVGCLYCIAMSSLRAGTSKAALAILGQVKLLEYHTALVEAGW
jgi:hypothetical protein